MKIYKVGGCVRDKILGVEPKDTDYVVTGASIQDMLDKGFKLVGKDFPVFIGKDGEEYALARKERKVSSGYHGFETEIHNVTIEEDLFRRDLTINAIAEDLETGELIDPYGGVEDIHNKILKPVSLHFREDPMRVLRAIRFYARFGTQWTIDPKIGNYHKVLMRSDEYWDLSTERYNIELFKAMKEPYWYLFFNHHIIKEILGVEDDGDVVGIPNIHPETAFFLLHDHSSGWRDAIENLMIAKDDKFKNNVYKTVWDMLLMFGAGTFPINPQDFQKVLQHKETNRRTIEVLTALSDHLNRNHHRYTKEAQRLCALYASALDTAWHETSYTMEKNKFDKYEMSHATINELVNARRFERFINAMYKF
jgi:tRNA nucleotidyltransferase/poly(A) polymerase